jgi:hypothetical protein
MGHRQPAPGDEQLREGRALRAWLDGRQVVPRQAALEPIRRETSCVDALAEQGGLLPPGERAREQAQVGEGLRGRPDASDQRPGTRPGAQGLQALEGHVGESRATVVQEDEADRPAQLRIGAAIPLAFEDLEHGGNRRVDRRRAEDPSRQIQPLGAGAPGWIEGEPAQEVGKGEQLLAIAPDVERVPPPERRHVRRDDLAPVGLRPGPDGGPAPGHLGDDHAHRARVVIAILAARQHVFQRLQQPPEGLPAAGDPLRCVRPVIRGGDGIHRRPFRLGERRATVVAGEVERPGQFAARRCRREHRAHPCPPSRTRASWRSNAAMLARTRSASAPPPRWI